MSLLHFFKVPSKIVSLLNYFKQQAGMNNGTRVLHQKFQKIASRCTVKRLGLVILLLLFLAFLPTILYLLSSRTGYHSREAFYTEIDLAENGNHSAFIPKIIHQIWIGPRALPPRFNECASTWRRLTSRGYEYRLWNMTSLTTFFRTRHNYFLSRWLNFKYMVNRVDTARYFLMYSFGGLYIDMDMCNKHDDPIALLQSKEYRGTGPQKRVLVQESLPSGFNPEVIMAPPRHPFLHHCLRSLYDSDRMYLLPYLYIMCVGGPIFLTNAVNSYVKKDDHIYLLPYMKSKEETFSSVSGGEWYTWDTTLIITVLYLGILHGKMVPYWISIPCVFFLSAFVILKLYRRVVSSRKTLR